jgi:hypothetical protein
VDRRVDREVNRRRPKEMEMKMEVNRRRPKEVNRRRLLLLLLRRRRRRPKEVNRRPKEVNRRRSPRLADQSVKRCLTRL